VQDFSSPWLCNERGFNSMSSGTNDDLSNTKAVVKGSLPRVSGGTTWLGHFENKQSGNIDLLILEGVYSIKEIAIKIEKAFPNVTDSEKRVEGHIEHLKTGDSRNRASGMKPHYLKIITDAANKVRFDIT
jgi:hypothetical protein